MMDMVAGLLMEVLQMIMGMRVMSLVRMMGMVLQVCEALWLFRMGVF